MKTFGLIFVLLLLPGGVTVGAFGFGLRQFIVHGRPSALAANCLAFGAATLTLYICAATLASLHNLASQNSWFVLLFAPPTAAYLICLGYAVVRRNLMPRAILAYALPAITTLAVLYLCTALLFGPSYAVGPLTLVNH